MDCLHFSMHDIYVLYRMDSRMVDRIAWCFPCSWDRPTDQLTDLSGKYTLLLMTHFPLKLPAPARIPIIGGLTHIYNWCVQVQGVVKKLPC